MGMNILHLHVKKKYFDQIKAGRKAYEYRRVTPYWKKKLVINDEPDLIMVYCGYPRKGDSARTLIFRYCGWIMQVNFLHPEFGNKPIDVYAISLRRPL